MGPFFQIQASLLVFLVYSCLWQDAQALKCPASWFLIGKYCYGYMHHPRSWTDAEDDCRTYGPDAFLASIHSHDEMKLLAEHILSNYYTPDRVWIGMHTPDAGWNRRWKWIDRSPTNYFSWNELEPNNLFFNENCVELYTYDLLYWNDNECYKVNPYVCKVSPS